MYALASIHCTYAGSSVMQPCTDWGSDPEGRYWRPGSSASSCQASLGRGMLEDLLICHSFARLNFYCVASSECSSNSFLQFPWSVPFLM